MDSKTSEETNQFHVDQKVVYPLQGVGNIKNIIERVHKSKLTRYYNIYLPVTDMHVLVPVDKAVELGIRAIVPQNKAQEALEIVGSNSDPVTADWKLRYQINLEHLKNGDITNIAIVVRNLYHRSKVKELPILERKLYDSAMNLLIDEITFALELSVEEVKRKIEEKLDSPNQKKKTSPLSVEEDEYPEEEDSF